MFTHNAPDDRLDPLSKQLTEVRQARFGPDIVQRRGHAETWPPLRTTMNTQQKDKK